MSNASDLTCPACGGSSIDIQALVWVRLTDDGSDADASHDGSHVWDSDSWYLCTDCASQGRVAELRGFTKGEMAD